MNPLYYGSRSEMLCLSKLKGLPGTRTPRMVRQLAGFSSKIATINTRLCRCLHQRAVCGGLLIEIVHFHQRYADNDVLAAYDGGVSARWQLCNDGRLA
jgi:hypothetical protein